MKTLIIYATKYGAAEQCAFEIAKKIKGQCDTINIKKSAVINSSEYDKIIIGGSIYASNIQKEIKTFCNAHMDILLKKPLGLFIVCMGLDHSMIEANFKLSFPEELMAHAIIADSLGGVLNPSKMRFLEWQIIKIIDKRLRKRGKPGLNLDGKNTVSTLSDERISIFAEHMNQTTENN